MRILVVDDDELLGDRLRLDLMADGHVVSTAMGHTAVNLLRAWPWDVMVVDMLMPEVDGVEMILAAKQLPHPPRIVAISGGGQISAEQCLNIAETFGADASLRKPVEAGVLARAVIGLTPPAPGHHT